MGHEAREGAPTWLRRVRNAQEAAKAIAEDGVLVAGFERTERKEIRNMQSILSKYPIHILLKYFKEYMVAKDSGQKGTFTDFFLSDEYRRSLLDTSAQNAREGDDPSDFIDSEALLNAKDIIEPVFEYIESATRKILAAFPDYEIAQSPGVRRDDYKAEEWHIDGEFKPEGSDFTVIINMYGEHTEFASDRDGAEMQTFGEGAVTVHKRGSEGAIHRSPSKKGKRFVVLFILVPKKKS